MSGVMGSVWGCGEWVSGEVCVVCGCGGGHVGVCASVCASMCTWGNAGWAGGGGRMVSTAPQGWQSAHSSVSGTWGKCQGLCNFCHWAQANEFNTSGSWGHYTAERT